MTNEDGTDREMEANARLIAAAPDIYEALELARKDLRKVCANCYPLDDIECWDAEADCSTWAALKKITHALNKARGLDD